MVLFGDSIKDNSPAGEWLVKHDVLLCIDTRVEVDYYRAGGILPFVLPQLLQPCHGLPQPST